MRKVIAEKVIYHRIGIRELSATILQFSTGEDWMGASHPIETGLAFFLFLFTGPGKLSVDKK